MEAAPHSWMVETPSIVAFAVNVLDNFDAVAHGNRGVGIVLIDEHVEADAGMRTDQGFQQQCFGCLNMIQT